jgi:serine/threonine protein kinase
MHEKQILHRDIKPDNFLMGIGKNSHIVYVVDLGLSKKYIREGKHIPYK